MIELLITVIDRTQFFYDTWEYCARFYLPEAHVLRKLDHHHIDRVIWTRKEWQRRNINFGGSWHHRSDPITDQMIQDLHDVCDFLQADQTPRKLVIYSNQIYIYANDIKLFERLFSIEKVRPDSITRARITGTPGHIMLKNPGHKLRTYLKNRRLDPKIAESIKQFLINQTDIRLSPSVKKWVSQNWNWVHSHYFLDHDHESVIMMLKMIDPALIRLTLPIDTAK